MNKNLARNLAAKKGIGFKKIGGIARFVFPDGTTSSIDSAAGLERVYGLPDYETPSNTPDGAVSLEGKTPEERDRILLEIMAKYENKAVTKRVLVLSPYPGRHLLEGMECEVLKETADGYILKNESPQREYGDPTAVFCPREMCIEVHIEQSFALRSEVDPLVSPTNEEE